MLFAGGWYDEIGSLQGGLHTLVSWQVHALVVALTLHSEGSPIRCSVEALEFSLGDALGAPYLGRPHISAPSASFWA